MYILEKIIFFLLPFFLRKFFRVTILVKINYKLKSNEWIQTFIPFFEFNDEDN